MVSTQCKFCCIIQNILDKLTTTTKKYYQNNLGLLNVCAASFVQFSTGNLSVITAWLTKTQTNYAISCWGTCLTPFWIWGGQSSESSGFVWDQRAKKKKKKNPPDAEVEILINEASAKQIISETAIKLQRQQKMSLTNGFISPHQREFGMRLNKCVLSSICQRVTANYKWALLLPCFMTFHESLQSVRRKWCGVSWRVVCSNGATGVLSDLK